MKFGIALMVGALFTASSFVGPMGAEEEKSSPPPEMVTYYFVLLTRGPKWTPEKTAETQKIQEAHMAGMVKLHDAGKLVLAGPFTDDSSWRGILILKTSSMDEAKALVEADAAVQAGRLAFEIHPWMTKKGMLP
jgi:uncharacterized protein YciI